MEKRPLVCVTDNDGKIYPLGGNMRLKALKELGYKELKKEWVTMADDWSIEKRNEFTIKDNVSFGAWDFDMLANEWEAEQLEEWGLDLPIDYDEEEDEAEEESTYIPSYKFEVSCNTEAEKNKLMGELLKKGFSCTDDY